MEWQSMRLQTSSGILTGLRIWWVIHFEKNANAAIGNSGNVIYVNPEENITAAVSSYFKPTVFDRMDFIEEVLLPCFR